MEITGQQDAPDWEALWGTADEQIADRLDGTSYLEFRRVLIMPLQPGENEKRAAHMPALVEDFSMEQLECMNWLVRQATSYGAPSGLPGPLPAAPSEEQIGALAAEVTEKTYRGQMAAVLLMAATLLRLLTERYP